LRQYTRHSGYQFLVGLVLVGGCMTASLNAILPSSQRQSAEIPRQTGAETLTGAEPAPSLQAEIEPANPVQTPRAPNTSTVDNAEAVRSETSASIRSPRGPTELAAAQEEIAAANTPAGEQLPNLRKDVLPEDATGTVPVERSERNETRQDLSYLVYYAYSEVAPETKPAEIVLDALKAIPSGTPIEEIKRISGLLGLNFIFMKTVAKIESGFDPKQRTGSYIGLFQISRREFAKYGVGDIFNPRDNAVAAALKIMAEAALFEMVTHTTPTLNDLYLIHQQGVDGAAEHVSHPHRLAWRSMCATEEGKEKGARWCKQAIWANTLPALKRAWRNVNNVSSGAFVAMWQERVSQFYARYSQASAN
jgi:hypothetical protein